MKDPMHDFEVSMTGLKDTLYRQQTLFKNTADQLSVIGMRLARAVTGVDDRDSYVKDEDVLDFKLTEAKLECRREFITVLERRYNDLDLNWNHYRDSLKVPNPSLTHKEFSDQGKHFCHHDKCRVIVRAGKTHCPDHGTNIG